MGLLHRARLWLRRNEPKSDRKEEIEREHFAHFGEKLDGVDVALFLDDNDDQSQYIVVYYHHGNSTKAVGRGNSVSKALEACAANVGYS